MHLGLYYQPDGSRAAQEDWTRWLNSLNTIWVAVESLEEASQGPSDMAEELRWGGVRGRQIDSGPEVLWWFSWAPERIRDKLMITSYRMKYVGTLAPVRTRTMDSQGKLNHCPPNTDGISAPKGHWFVKLYQLICRYPENTDGSLRTRTLLLTLDYTEHAHAHTHVHIQIYTQTSPVTQIILEKSKRPIIFHKENEELLAPAKVEWAHDSLSLLLIPANSGHIAKQLDEHRGKQTDCRGEGKTKRMTICSKLTGLVFLLYLWPEGSWCPRTVRTIRTLRGTFLSPTRRQKNRGPVS